MRLLAGTGVSRARDGAMAGAEAATEAVRALGGQPPALVIVFTAPKYELHALLDAIRSVTGSAPLVGATGSGEIAQGQYLGFGGGVAVLAVTAGPYRFGIASRSHIRGDLNAAGQAIARESKAQAGACPHGAVLLLADSLLGDLQELVHGVYRVAGARVPISGGAAGDEQKFIRTFVFHDDSIVEEGAVAVWIGSSHPLTVVVGHGWQPIGEPLLVTRAEGTELMEIGGAHADDVYERQLGLAPHTLSPESFWGTSILHPFGIPQDDGSMVIRVARSKTPGGSLMIQGCVPPAGAAVQVMRGSAEALLGVVEDVVGRALRAAPEPGVLLTFSCAARAAIYGPRAEEEPRRLQQAAGGVPTFGFFCCGEFARTAGVLATHNASLVAVAL